MTAGNVSEYAQHMTRFKTWKHENQFNTKSTRSSSNNLISGQKSTTKIIYIVLQASVRLF